MTLSRLVSLSRLRCVSLVVTVLLVAGCSLLGVPKSVKFTEAEPDGLILIGLQIKSDKDYVTGQYDLYLGKYDKGTNKIIDRKAIDIVKGSAAPVPEKVTGESAFYLVRVPPGDYFVASFLASGPKVAQTTDFFENKTLAFAVAPGHLLYLGTYVIDASATPATVTDIDFHTEPAAAYLGQYPDVRVRMELVPPSFMQFPG